MARGYVQKKHGMWFGVACNGQHQDGSTNAKYDPKSFPSHEECIKLKQLAWSRSQPKDFFRLYTKIPHLPPIHGTGIFAYMNSSFFMVNVGTHKTCMDVMGQNFVDCVAMNIVYSIYL